MHANGFSTPDLPPALLALGRRALEGDLSTDRGAGWLQSDLDWAVESVAPFCGVDRGQLVTGLERHAGRYLPAAEDWLDRHLEHPWIAPFSRERQGWVAAWGDAPPDPAEFVPSPPPGPGDSPFGCTPRGAATTTQVDGDIWPAPEVRGTAAGAPVWTFVAPPSARVLEIRTAADWAALVTAHPLVLTDAPEAMYDMALPAGLVGVDWRSAATEWDGIRFTIDGILRAAYVTVPVPGGVTAFIPWDVGWERTVWLRWVFTDVAPGAPWRHPHDS